MEQTMHFDFLASHFMLQDILYTLIAFLVLPLFIMAPGYVIGWAADVLDFRQRRFLTRLLLGTTLSVAVVPAFTFLVVRFTHLKTMWWIFIPSWIIFFWLIFPHLRRFKFPQDRWVRWSIGLTLIWVVIALFSLVDIQLDQRVYFNVTAFDWTHRVAITDAIARTGIPPVNPFFFTGEPVYVSYYYFWSIIPALLNQFTGGIITARIAFVASAIWCGIALRAITALYQRFHSPEGKHHIEQRSVAANCLLFVTGLDMIFVFLLITRMPDFPGIFEKWNGNAQITSWSGASLWVPNHVASLIACLVGYILFQGITQLTPIRKKLATTILIGISLASAVGMSIYIPFIFIVFWGLWTLVSLFTNELRYKLIWLFLAGLLAFIFTVPFAYDVLESRDNLSTGGNLFAFWVRPIFLVESNSLVQQFIHSETLLNLINLILLPVNYFLELGFFLLAGLLYLQAAYKEHKALDILKPDFLLLLASVLVCSFLRSSMIFNNDLGWRGFLPAQFILLIWSANVLLNLFPTWFRKLNDGTPIKMSYMIRFTLVLTLVIGFFSSAFDILHSRFFFWMNDTQTWLTSQGGVYTDQNIGNRTYSLRQAYQFINEYYPKDSIIQNNPDVPDIDLSQGLYANHQTVVSGPGAMTYGVSLPAYKQLADQITPIFSDSSISSENVNDLCSKYSIDVMIVTDIDPVWKGSYSWIWQQQPIFETPSVRLFKCSLIHEN